MLLYNDRGEVTESTIANVVVEIAGALLTPPIACGLLPGTLRAHLLEDGTIAREGAHLRGSEGASRCYLLNSVRGFHPTFRVIACQSVESRVPTSCRIPIAVNISNLI